MRDEEHFQLVSTANHKENGDLPEQKRGQARLIHFSWNRLLLVLWCILCPTILLFVASDVSIVITTRSTTQKPPSRLAPSSNQSEKIRMYDATIRMKECQPIGPPRRRKGYELWRVNADCRDEGVSTSTLDIDASSTSECAHQCLEDSECNYFSYAEHHPSWSICLKYSKCAEPTITGSSQFYDLYQINDVAGYQLHVNSACTHAIGYRLTGYNENLIGFTCPSVVDNTNWDTEGWDTLEDTFHVTTSGGNWTVERANEQSGWCMRLKFTCVATNHRFSPSPMKYIANYGPSNCFDRNTSYITSLHDFGVTSICDEDIVCHVDGDLSQPERWFCFATNVTAESNTNMKGNMKLSPTEPHTHFYKQCSSYTQRNWVRRYAMPESLLLNLITSQQPPSCDTFYIGPIILFQPIDYDFHNPWHLMEDILALFITYAYFKLSRQNTRLFIPYSKQLVLQLDKTERPLFAFVQDLFGKVIFQEESGTNCFEKLIIPLPAKASHMSDKLRKDCGSSPIFQGFRDYVLDVYGLKHNSRLRSAQITIVNRAQGVSNRKWRDPEQLKKDLQKQFPTYPINVVDFATISFEEQLKVIVEQTDIFVGFHGAALTNLRFLSPCGVLVELYGRGGNWHFKNDARDLGIHYIRSRAAGAGRPEFLSVDIKELSEDIKFAVQNYEYCIRKQERFLTPCITFEKQKN